MTRFFSVVLAVLTLPLIASAAPVPGVYAFRFGSFWHGFCHYWHELIGSVNGAVMVAIVMGAIGLFIVTRGKWIK